MNALEGLVRRGWDAEVFMAKNVLSGQKPEICIRLKKLFRGSHCNAGGTGHDYGNAVANAAKIVMQIEEREARYAAEKPRSDATLPAWAEHTARDLDDAHWKGLRWLSHRPAPHLFPSGSGAHGMLVATYRCVEEPTVDKPYWSLSARGVALLDEVRRLAHLHEEDLHRVAPEARIEWLAFRVGSQPLAKAIEKVLDDA